MDEATLKAVETARKESMEAALHLWDTDLRQLFERTLQHAMEADTDYDDCSVSECMTDTIAKAILGELEYYERRKIMEAANIRVPRWSFWDYEIVKHAVYGLFHGAPELPHREDILDLLERMEADTGYTLHTLENTLNAKHAIPLNERGE